MTDTEKKELVEKIVNALVPDLKPEVDRIEASVATTKGHYANYGQLLSVVGKGDKNKTRIVALALVRAGANKQGVADGLRHFCGIEV